MRTVEVIDLLSSSSPTAGDEPKSAPRFGPGARTSHLAAAGVGSVFKGNARGRATRCDDEWLDVSDFSDGGLEPTKAAAVASLSDRGVLGDARLGKGVGKAGEDEDAGLWVADDGYKNPGSFPRVPVAKLVPVSVPDDSGNYIRNRDVDSWFLPDDFGCTSNPERSFDLGLGPVKKKLRLTPEPEPRITAGKTTSRGKGMARAASDVAVVSKVSLPSMAMAKPAGLVRSKSTVMEDDPIVFTSSPEILKLARERREKAWRERDTETEDDVFGHLAAASGQSKSSSLKSGIGAATAARSRAMPLRERGPGDVVDSASDSDLPDISELPRKSSLATICGTRRAADGASVTSGAKKTAGYEAREKACKATDQVLGAGNTEKTAEQKAREKVRKAQERQDAKEAEKERKRLAKEERARERQAAADLAKVNTLRTDKKISTPEMIVDLPVDLDAKLATQARQFLEPLGVECTEWNSPIQNVIKWRRKVEARFNEEAGHWEPTEKRIEPEKHVMCVMLAREFADLATGEQGHDLDAHVLKIKAKFNDSTIIYLIEGLTTWIRKNRNVKNREFTDAVRNQIPQEAVTVPSSQRHRKKKQEKYVDEDMIEDALLRLQVIHATLIHHTACMVESAQWVMTFTQHISTIPYR
jgi:crossover junction endonuclease EME1